jgi:hypothetical protein
MNASRHSRFRPKVAVRHGEQRAKRLLVLARDPRRISNLKREVDRRMKACDIGQKPNRRPMALDNRCEVRPIDRTATALLLRRFSARQRDQQPLIAAASRTKENSSNPNPARIAFRLNCGSHA